MSQDVKEIAGVIADFIEQQTTKDTRDDVLEILSARYKRLAYAYEFTSVKPPLRNTTRHTDREIDSSMESFCDNLSRMSSMGWEIFAGTCTGPNETTMLRRRK